MKTPPRLQMFFDFTPTRPARPTAIRHPTQSNAALALACSGLVVNMTSGRTIRAEMGEKYPYLNRDGVGMPAGREASGPLEASLWDGLGQARLVV
jgi:hypothetical protein